MTEGGMITVRLIQDLVCQHFGITRDQLLVDDRHIRFARPRQIAMILAREFSGQSFPEIGQQFCRDHTTVLWASRKRARIEGDKAYGPALLALSESLKAPEKVVSFLREVQMRRQWEQDAQLTRVAGGFHNG